MLIAVSGAAGVGNTTVEMRWAHQVTGRFPDGHLHADVRGFDADEAPAAPADTIRRFLEALGVRMPQIPTDLDAQVGLYRSRLAGQRMLLVLDNARDAEQVRPLLPGAPGRLVIVTSRDQLTSLVAVQAAHPVTLDLLRPQEARALLARRLGRDRLAAEPDAVDRIIASCAGLPLALAIAAARPATRGDFPLAALAAQLRDARTNLDVFDDGDATGGIRAVFSWSYHKLHPDAARLFRLLGVHAGADLAAPAVASLAGIPPQQARRLLDELCRAHLLVERVAGRYRIHDLLRAYASDLTPQQRGVMVGTVIDYPEALGWFIAEHQVLLAAVDTAVNASLDRAWFRWSRASA
jgi:hypothetical protein